MNSLVWDKSLVGNALSAIGGLTVDVLEYARDLLNLYCGGAYSSDYYNVLLGDWLLHFTHIVYAEWQECVSGRYLSGVTGRVNFPVAGDLSDHGRLRLQNEYRESLRAGIIAMLEKPSFEGFDFSNERVAVDPRYGFEDNKWFFSFNRFRASTIKAIPRIIGSSKADILVSSPYSKNSINTWFLALWKWRRFLAHNDFCYPVSISATIDSAWRLARSLEQRSLPGFEGILRSLIPLHLPVALLEGFVDLRKTVLSIPHHRPKAVYSANALHNQLVWKIRVAEWREEGTKLLYHQHGGGYGLDRIHAIEEYETSVSDRYYTFGWHSDQAHIKPLPVGMGPINRHSPQRILLSCVNYPKVVYRIHFQPMPGTVEVMHRQTCDFLKALPDRSDLLVRPFFEDYGWGFVDMMRRAAPDAEFDTAGVSSFMRYAESKLVVHNYLGTGWLETLALDIPTVCFYDDNTYAFRDAAQPYINGLEVVGILHRSGKSAAAFVAGLGNNIESWWKEAEVQDARRAFVSNYANFSPDWMKHWEQEFKSVLDEAV